MDPREFHFDVAVPLWNGVPIPKLSEATSRAVVGRAYYACYLAVRAKLRGVRGASYDPSHQDLLNDLLAAGQPSDVRSILGAGIGSLRSLRVTSDYRPDMVVTRGQAEYALEVAEEVLGALPTLSPV